MSYTQILYQIVFGTHKHEKTLVAENRKELYKYIWGLLKNKKCHLYRIGGVEDHMHIVTSIHQTIAPANLVKDIKLSSDTFIKEKHLFPNFDGWAVGYGAFTYHINQKDTLINYLINQEEHHKTKLFRDEFIELLNEHGIEFDEKYLL